MDGVLIDSEPFWQEAAIKAFRRVGVAMTREMMAETTGLRVDEVVRLRYEQFGWNDKSCQAVESDILDELDLLIDGRGSRMAGVAYILNFFKSRNLRVALASSSHFRVITAVLSKLQLQGQFEFVHSGELEPKGKPDPAIYLTCLRKLGLPAHEVVAFEDSFNGLAAARAARLKTVAIPDESVWQQDRFDAADLKLRSLHEFTEEHLAKL